MFFVRKLHYKSKLILCYLALVSIPLIVMMVPLYNSMIKPVRENAILSIQNQMDQAENKVLGKMENIESVAAFVSSNTTINHFFLTKYYDDIEIINIMNNEIYPLFSWLTVSNADIFHFNFFTGNPYIPETNFFQYYETYKDEAWMQTARTELLSAESYWEPAHPYRTYHYGRMSTSPLVYSLFYPLQTTDNYLEVCVLPSVIFDAVEDSSVLSTGFLAAANRDGNIISGNIPHDLRQPLEIFLSEKLENSAISSSSYTAEIADTKYFVSHRLIESLDTWLICIVPYSDITEPLLTAIQYYFLSVFVIIAGIVLLSWLLSTLLIRRINKMTESVQQIQEGNFDISIPLNGNDEIDQLGHAINYMAYKINDLINRVYKAEVLQKETELAALQAQINPHFLFNILDTFKMIAIINDLDDFSESIAALGSLMRYNISSSQKFFPLCQELKILQDYIKIQNLLLNNRVRLIISVPDELLNFEIPNFVLQPIAENAFVHGFKDKQDQLVLKVTASRQVQKIEIRVEDNGSGIDAVRQKELTHSMENSAYSATSIAKGESIGLANVYARLYLHFKNTVSIRFRTSDLGGACIILILPAPDRN